jgi:hypothetical protein
MFILFFFGFLVSVHCGSWPAFGFDAQHTSLWQGTGAGAQCLAQVQYTVQLDLTTPTVSISVFLNGKAVDYTDSLFGNVNGHFIIPRSSVACYFRFFF